MKEVFETIKEKFKATMQAINNQDYVDDYRGVDDWETRDKEVRTLRRQVRRIQDEDEKAQLKEIIRRREKARSDSWIQDDNILRYNTYRIGKSNNGKISFIGGEKRKNGRKKH